MHVLMGVALRLIEAILDCIQDKAIEELDKFIKSFPLPAWEHRFAPLANFRDWRFQERGRLVVHHYIHELKIVATDSFVFSHMRRHRFMQYFPLILFTFLRSEHISTRKEQAVAMMEENGLGTNTGRAVELLVAVSAKFASLLQVCLVKEVIVNETSKQMRDAIFSFRDLFVRTFGREQVCNSRFIHSILHLPDNVDDLGPLWVSMEDYFETSHLVGKAVRLKF